MRKHLQARKATIGRGWRALCSAVPLLVIFATLFVVPPVAIAQEAPPAAEATGPSGASGAPSPTEASGPIGTSGPTGTSGQAAPPACDFASLPNGLPQSPTASVTTDKPSYFSGELVTLTGAGGVGINSLDSRHAELV